MPRVLILGGGFGGISCAYHLRHLAPDVEIILVDRRSYFMVGFRKSWALVGASPLQAGQRPLKNLERFGIRIVEGEITAIDPTARAAEVDGQSIEADALVVALGAELAPEQVPGCQEHALNVYDPNQVIRASDAVGDISNARVVIGI